MKKKIKKKKKKPLTRILIFGLENGSNLKFVLNHLLKVSKKYAAVKLGFFEEDMTWGAMGFAWGARVGLPKGVYEVGNQFLFKVYKPEWTQGKPPYVRPKKWKERRRQYRKLVEEMVKECGRAIFYVKWESQRNEYFYNRLRKNGIPCKTVFCPDIKKPKREVD